MTISSQNIKMLRKELDISVRELAELIHISEDRIRAWESGRGSPKVEDSQKIQNFFKINYDLLHKGLITKYQLSEIISKLKKPPLKPRHNDHDDGKKDTPLPFTLDDEYMAYLLKLSLIDLLALQSEETDVEKIKLLHEVITLKQELEFLRKENRLLRENNDFLRAGTPPKK